MADSTIEYLTPVSHVLEHYLNIPAPVTPAEPFAAELVDSRAICFLMGAYAKEGASYNRLDWLQKAKELVLMVCRGESAQADSPKNRICCFGFYPFGLAIETLRDASILVGEELEQALATLVVVTQRLLQELAREEHGNHNRNFLRYTGALQASKLIQSTADNRLLTSLASARERTFAALLEPSSEDSAMYNSVWFLCAVWCWQLLRPEISEMPAAVAWGRNYFLTLQAPDGHIPDFGDRSGLPGPESVCAALEMIATETGDGQARWGAQQLFAATSRMIYQTDGSLVLPGGGQKKGITAAIFALTFANEASRQQVVSPVPPVDLASDIGHKSILRSNWSPEDGLYVLLNRSCSKAHGHRDPGALNDMSKGRQLMLGDTPYEETRTIRHNTLTQLPGLQSREEIESYIREPDRLSTHPYMLWSAHDTVLNAVGGLMSNKAASSEIWDGPYHRVSPTGWDWKRVALLIDDRAIAVRDDLFFFEPSTIISPYYGNAVLSQGQVDDCSYFVLDPIRRYDAHTDIIDGEPRPYRLLLIFQAHADAWLDGRVDNPSHVYADHYNLSCVYQAIHAERITNSELSAVLVCMPAKANPVEEVRRYRYALTARGLLIGNSEK